LISDPKPAAKYFILPYIRGGRKDEIEYFIYINIHTIPSRIL